MKKKVLAPAGNFEIAERLLKTDIDELFLGLSNWSLRSPRYELKQYEICEINKLAKRNGKILRVCLNTIPWETDLLSFDTEIQKLSENEITSIVLADMGSIRHVSKYYPHINIQASVACDVRNIEDVLFIKEIGASSVTLLYPTVQFIREIKTKCEIEVIIFAFGYYNYTFRSRCYMSSYLQHIFDSQSQNRENTSGSFNREGYCNRACKCMWSLNSDSSKINDVTMNSYPFFQIERIKELFDAGADSLKIQGREYSDSIVEEAVNLYTEVVERYNDDPVSFSVPEEFISKASKIDVRRHNEMRNRSKEMIEEMLKVDIYGNNIIKNN